MFLQVSGEATKKLIGFLSLTASSVKFASRRARDCNVNGQMTLKPSSALEKHVINNFVSLAQSKLINGTLFCVLGDTKMKNTNAKTDAKRFRGVGGRQGRDLASLGFAIRHIPIRALYSY